MNVKPPFRAFLDEVAKWKSQTSCYMEHTFLRRFTWKEIAIFDTFPLASYSTQFARNFVPSIFMFFLPSEGKWFGPDVFIFPPFFDKVIRAISKTPLSTQGTKDFSNLNEWISNSNNNVIPHDCSFCWNYNLAQLNKIMS